MKKAERIKSHKLFGLMTILADELDGIDTISGDAKQIKEKCRELLDLLDPKIDSIFQHSEKVSKTTYIQEVTNKIDTIFRKNYESM